MGYNQFRTVSNNYKDPRFQKTLKYLNKIHPLSKFITIDELKSIKATEALEQTFALGTATRIYYMPEDLNELNNELLSKTRERKLNN